MNKKQKQKTAPTVVDKVETTYMWRFYRLMYVVRIHKMTRSHLLEGKAIFILQKEVQLESLNP